MYLKSNNINECCGCRACAEICPPKCISMEEDSEGFLYPAVDTKKCVSCGLCERVCPQSRVISKSADTAIVRIGVRKENKDASASGGAFAAICEQLMLDEYIVFGVIFDANFNVLHTAASTKRDCESFKKSKYVLSNTNGSYEKVSKYLLEGKKVLFSGTPCQCSALLQYIETKRIDRTNLLVVDLICHGAPNQAVFDSYRAELERNHSHKLTKYSFRNKEPIRGIVNSRTAEYKTDNNRRYLVTPRNDPFLKGYYSRLFYRPSCAECRFAKPDRVSDITLGDAWGIEKNVPHWNSLEGVSLVIANTEKGKNIVEKLNDNMDLLPSSIQWAKENNQQLSIPTQMHAKRDMFFELWNKDRKCFSQAVKLATKRNMLIRVKNRIKCMVEKLK